jgi:hypothetical protein
MVYGRKNARKQYTGPMAGQDQSGAFEDDEDNLYGSAGIPTYQAEANLGGGPTAGGGGGGWGDSAMMDESQGTAMSPVSGYNEYAGADASYAGGFQKDPRMDPVLDLGRDSFGVDEAALADIAGNQDLGDLDEEGSREVSSQAMYDRILDLLSGQGMDTSEVEAGIMDEYRSDLGQGMGGLMAQMGGAGWGQSGLMGVHAADLQKQLSREATREVYNTRAAARDQMLREYGQAASMAGAAGDLELQQMLVDLIQNEMETGDEPSGDDNIPGNFTQGSEYRDNDGKVQSASGGTFNGTVQDFLSQYPNATLVDVQGTGTGSTHKRHIYSVQNEDGTTTEFIVYSDQGPNESTQGTPAEYAPVIGLLLDALSKGNQ